MSNDKLHVLRYPHPEKGTEAGLLAALKRANRQPGLELFIHNCSGTMDLAAKIELLGNTASTEDLVLVLGNSPKLVTPGSINLAAQLLRQAHPTVVLVPDYNANHKLQVPAPEDNTDSDYDFLEHSHFSSLNPNGMLSAPVYMETFFCRQSSLKGLVDGSGLERSALYMLTSEASVGLSDTPLTQQAVIPESLLATLNIYGAIKRAPQMHLRKALQTPTVKRVADSNQPAPPPSINEGSAPRLSIIVIVYSMPRQAMNTLHSLSTSYQQQVDDSQYEVIVIENDSGNNLDPAEVQALGRHFHYHLRNEDGVSPAAAINAGLAQCRASLVGLMIDGARMLSPGVIRQALVAKEICEHPLALVPSYDLGPELQQNNHNSGYNEDTEIALLESIRWPKEGYDLFNIAVLGEANDKGYINPMMEATCLFAPASAWQQIGGADERFQYPGGGSLNLHMFRSLGLQEGAELLVLAGEGAFHQFHGGVTTDAASGVDAKAALFRAELDQYWDGNYNGLRRMPKLMGFISPQATDHLDFSCDRSIKRLFRFKTNKKHPWPDDPEAELAEPPFQY